MTVELDPASTSSETAQPTTDVGSDASQARRPGGLAKKLAAEARAWRQEAADVAAAWKASLPERTSVAAHHQQHRTRVNEILTRAAQLAARAILRAPADPYEFYHEIAAAMDGRWTATSNRHPGAALTRLFGQTAVSADAARRAARAMDEIAKKIAAEMPGASVVAREKRTLELLSTGVGNNQPRKPDSAPATGDRYTLHGPALATLKRGDRFRAVLICETDSFRILYMTDLAARVRLVPGPNHAPRDEAQLKSFSPKADLRLANGHATLNAIPDVLRLVLSGSYTAEAYELSEAQPDKSP